jgi:ribonuclease Z
MRPAFFTRLVNGPLFDPVLFVRMANRRRSLLFDCGRLCGISNREMLSVDAVFVTHTHMDHFMGFDELLRAVLHRDRPLHVYGPEGIIDRITARLASYTWNLTRGYALEVFVHEIREGREIVSTLRAADGFVRTPGVILPRDGPTVAVMPRCLVEAVILDHNVPCMGYVLREPVHVHVRPNVLRERGYATGDWICELKDRAARGRLEGTMAVPTHGGLEERAVAGLAEELLLTSPGVKIGYLTDFRASPENLERISKAARGLDTLFIEAHYLSEREDEAYVKAHLSARQAGMIACMAGAARVVPMHVSPRYHDRLDEILSEVQGAFPEAKKRPRVVTGPGRHGRVRPATGQGRPSQA